MLAPQQQAEVRFWQDVFFKEEGGNVDSYLRRRRADYQAAEVWFLPTIQEEEGLGLDLGCGLISLLGMRGTPVVAVDPLLEEYQRMLHDPSPHVTYQKQTGEGLWFQDQGFDYVWCINVIDHTPNPEQMVAEIVRVLKPGGHLYFSVNFDPELYAPHYHLWNRSKVDQMMGALKLLEGAERWFSEHNKFVFTGIYQRA